MLFATILMLSGAVLVTGVLLAFTPYLMRRRELFAVTVPETAQNDPRLRAMKKRYATIMLAVTAVCAVAWIPFAAADPSTAALVLGADGGTTTAADTTTASAADAATTTADPGAFAFTVALTAALMVPIVTSFCLMLFYRGKVRAIKDEEGWAPARQEAVAQIDEDNVPRAIPLAWNLVYVPIILFTVALIVIYYPSIPDTIPMHMDFEGNVNRWEPKTPFTVGFPVLVQLFMTACFLFSHWSITRSKKPLDPAAPATSALAYGLFARAQSAFLLITGVLTNLVIGVTFTLSVASVISMETALALILIVVFVVVLGAIALTVVYGQSGARVFKRLQGSGQLLYDDDEHWKLGVIYWNPNDASLFLPERFGIGWTVNMARPAAWGIIAGIAAITVAFVAAVTLLI